MPRRPSHLAPSDGPLARFALKLRGLRDAAGFEAPSVDQIAARTHIPRSTLFAALRGRRLPTRSVLGALVTAWGGDATEWLTRRTATEAELEELRAARPSKGRVTPTAVPKVKPALALEQAPKATPPPIPEQAGDGKLLSAMQDMAEQLRRLRVEAGAPSLRQLSKKIEENPAFPGIASPSTLSDLFSGKRLPKWPVLESVVRALDGDEKQWLLTWERLVMLREVQALTTAKDPTRPWAPYPEE